MTQHGIPALERAIDILECLAASGDALSIRDIAARTGLVRSTVYRSLNTLQSRSFVRQENATTYVLGPQLLRLARAVPRGVDLVELARPVLQKLAADIGASAKLSVLDGGDALVVATAEGPGAYSITTQVGRRFPLHAGGASKMLLAHAPASLRSAYMARDLARFTDHTITDPKRLGRELDHVLAAGLSLDQGEYAEGVHAAAVPVMDPAGACVAALSAPFPATSSAERVADIVAALREAASALERSIGI
jgi:DNA-binding IclR family transcriptional regulator